MSELSCQGIEDGVRKLRRMGIVQWINYGRLYNSSPEYLPQVALDDTLFTKVGKHNQTDNQKRRMSKILR